jgi:hypothetical protein
MREDTRKLLERSSAEHNWKLALIQHSIYGADIQPIAVQIAKLRCFISLLVDFKVDPNEENMGVPSLPNLDFKFVAANSLIPVPGEHTVREGELALTDDFFDAFAKAAEAYYYVRDPAEKAALRQRIETLINDRIERMESALADQRGDAHTREDLRNALARRNQSAIERAEREIALWESYRNLFAFRNAPVGFFDMRYFFPEVKDGFDITIGNPPYVRADEPSKENRAQRAAIMACEAYDTLWEKWDLFVPFIERAYKLLRPGGVSAMIVSDAFCHSKYAQKPQNWFLQNARILRLDFCSDLKIFDAAVHNLIYFFQKADGSQHKPERRLHKDEFGKVEKLPSDRQDKLTYRAFFPEDSSSGNLLVGTPIANICYVSYGLRPNSDENEAKGAFTTADLVANGKDKVHCRPYVEGKHLAGWLPACNQWIEWGTERAPGRFCRPTFPEMYTVEEKIIAQRSPGPDPVISYDNKQFIFTPASVGFIPWHMLSGVRNRSLKKATRYKDEKPTRPDLPRREDLEATSRRFAVKYLLAVMNSTVARDFLRANRRSNIHLYPDDWKKLPIPDVPEAKQKPIMEIVDRILAARRADPKADIAELEAKVDAMVTELYGIDAATTTTAIAEPTKTTTAAQKTRKADLKEFLRDECLPALRTKYTYFDIETLREKIKSAKLECAQETLKRYMAEMEEGGFAFDAGRGWYCFVKEPFTLNTEPVEETVALLEKQFPFLDFSCWSTMQINPFMHHLLAKFVTFVQVDRDLMSSVFDFLRDEKEMTVYLNPSTKKECEALRVSENTVVIRPSVTGAPGKGHMAPIEKILVDLAVEVGKLPLMGSDEFNQMATRAVTAGRISIGALGRYAKRRNLGFEDVFGSDNQLMSKTVEK